MSRKLRLKPVVFLDRDGTINIERGHIKKLEDFELLDGVADAIRALNRAQISVVVVTNQSGVARGYFPETHIHAVHEKMYRLLNELGAHVDALYFCPHLPEGVVPKYSLKCSCRKPGTGLVEMAYRADPELDQGRAFVVGDTDRDMNLAAGCRARAIFVETGKCRLSELAEVGSSPDFVAGSLSSAVEWILSELGATETRISC